MNTQENNTGLVIPENQTIATANENAPFSDFTVNQLSPEQQFEIAKDILAAQQEIETLAMPQMQSKQLVGKEFNILGAAFRSIPDDKDGGQKTVISFVLELHESGEQVTCLKSSNAINDVYVNYFDRMRGVMYKPLENYTFAEDTRYTRNGNAAIVLRKMPKRVTTAGKAK